MADVFQGEPVRFRASSPIPRLMRLTLKEMRETLRDRRTIMTLLLMPVLLYPLLTLAFQRFVLSSAANLKVEYILGFETEEASRIVGTCLQLAEGEAPSIRSTRKTPSLIELPKIANAKPTEKPQIRYEITQHLERDVQDYRVDVGIRIKPNTRPQLRPDSDIAVDLELVYLPGNKLGERARDYMESLLNSASKSFLRFRLESLGLSQRAEPVRVADAPLRDPEEMHNQMLSAIIPVVLILMTITGAVYPAIDLTAGERERGTMEMLVAAPVPRLGLLFAKYVAVLSVAFLTAGINLAAMTVTLLVSGMGTMLFGDRGLSLVTALEVFALLILFASFFSAVLLVVTSFARSFKEAQAYLIPLMLVSLGPGLTGLMPGIKLAGALQVAPLVNVVLLARDLLQGQASLFSAALVVGSTLLYAAAALGVAARIFGGHAILYESQTAWSDLFRRPTAPQPAPQVASAMLCLALLFPICFVLKGVLGQLAGERIEMQLLLTSLATFSAFMLLPWWAARLGNVPFSLAFAARRPPVLAVLGGVLCGLSLWPFAHELIVVLHNLGLVTIDESQFKGAQELIERCRQAPLALVLLTFAVLPGLCEEFCFRGYLFRSFETRLSGWQTILATGAIFGLFHLVAVDHLAIERLAPTTFLGCILGWIRWRTNSLWPGMCLHITHNGFLAALFYYENVLKAKGWDIEGEQHLPPTWIAGAVVVSGIGLTLIGWAGATRRRMPPAA
ncbi:MAG: Abortive infection protein [Planctomycetaceae bacterium]|nr:Abortive infection protein [Planctomycetaceae bacterium]